MPNEPRKSRTIAFKVEASLAAFLERVPNRSEFIRRAILSELHRECPLCHGAGIVPIGIGEHFAELVEKQPE